MSTQAAPVPNPRLPLPLITQELLTAIVRVRGRRAGMQTAEGFRSNIRQLLQRAEQTARQAGYSDADVQRAMFAVVAFLDESLIPIYPDWERAPLGPEWFQGHTGGERFYVELRRLLEGDNSVLTADLLEIYQTCLLLGYRGKLGDRNEASVKAILDRVEAKISRIRGGRGGLSPSGRLPEEPTPKERDKGGLVLLYATCALGLLALLLFGIYNWHLQSALQTLQ